MKALSKKAIKEQEKQEAINTLLTLLKPKDVIYTDIKSVSSSGMSRQITCYITPTNELGLNDITWLVSKACGLTIGSKGGLVVEGCGMDMAFVVVYNLGRILWPNGTPEPHGRRNGVPDSDGGYALVKGSL